MSLLTRCPACQTQFKVAPDQLRVSDGWVRCGQCRLVFNAAQQCLAEPAQPVAPALSQAAPVGLPDPAGEGRLEPAPAATALAEPLAEPGTLSFLRAGATPAPWWSAPPMRLALQVLCAVLVLGLLAQAVVYQRDSIAAYQPGLKPVLQALCAPINCVVAPLRRIESVVIDSATLGQTADGVYRLKFTVKNTAPTALALPAIELTLTDAQDQPFVRRVFLPAQLGATGDTLAAGADWQASLDLSVDAAVSSDHVAGYRVLAFYP